MSQREKMLAGELYDPFDPELLAARSRARDLCQQLNTTRESEEAERRRILRDLFGKGASDFTLFGPAVQIYTPLHPFNAAQRRREELGKPIDIGSDVWVGGGAIILAGVRIRLASSHRSRQRRDARCARGWIRRRQSVSRRPHGWRVNRADSLRRQTQASWLLPRRCGQKCDAERALDNVVSRPHRDISWHGSRDFPAFILRGFRLVTLPGKAHSPFTLTIVNRRHKWEEDACATHISVSIPSTTG